METAPGKAKLKIALLGPPVVTLNNFPLVIPRKITRELLFYLCNQNQAVSRSTLCSLFWPALPEAQARKNLRENLSLLRKALGSDTYLLGDSDQVEFNFTNVYVDSLDFQQIMERVHFSLDALPTGKLPDSLYRTLREAIKLWRTPHFMDGFLANNHVEFDIWQSQVGQRLEYWRQYIAERLADHNITQGNLQEANYWLVAALDSDPLNTDLHYLVLTCLRDLGKKTDLIRYHDLLERIYVKEHGESIPQLLLDFYARIGDSANFSPGSQGQLWPGITHTRTQFVGRKEQLQQLNHYLHQGGIAIVKGDSGIGKSRLMEEFYSRLEVSVRLLFCAAQPMEKSLPFQPIIDGLKKSLRTGELESLPEKALATLSRTFPDLFATKENQGSFKPHGLAGSYQAILESFCEIFNLMSEKHRLLIIMDDAQWCDEATLSLFSYLDEQGFFKTRGFLLIAAETRVESRILDEFIQHHQASGYFRNILLEGLSENEISNLVYLTMGKALSEETIGNLKRKTGGNPLFILEILKNLMGTAHSLEEISSLEQLPIPPSVQNIIMSYIQELDANSMAVVTAAAMLGSRFTPDLIELTCHLSQDEIVNSLERLEKSHAIVSVPEMKPAGGYSFTHEKIRESLVNSLSPARKRMYALRAINAIAERRGRPLSYAAIFAQFYEIAGETNLAFKEWMKAAAFARQHFAQKDTYAAFQHALDLCMQYEDVISEQDFYDLLTKWADYAYDLSDVQTLENIYSDCISFGERRKSALLTGTGLSGEVRVAGILGQFASGMSHTGPALRYLQNAQADGEIVELFVRQGILYHFSLDYKSAKTCYEKALTYPVVQRSYRLQDALFNAKTLLVFIYCQMGWPKKGEELAMEAYTEGEFLERQSIRFQVKAMLAMAAFYQGKYHNALQTAREALSQTEHLQLPWWNSLICTTIARSYIFTGYLDEAWAMIENAKQYTELSGMGYWDSELNCIKGDFFRFLCDFDLAREYYRKGIREDILDFNSLENKYLLGYSLGMEGNDEKGIALIEETIREAETNELGMITLPARITMLSLPCKKKGDPRDIENLETLRIETAERGMGSSPVMLRILGADLMLEQGKYPEAESEYAQAAKEARVILNPWLELSICRKISDNGNFSAKARRKAIARTQSIFEFLEEHANTDMCREELTQFRKHYETVAKYL